MPVNVKIADDVVEQLENLMGEEDLGSLAEAVDFVLSDYFELSDEDSEEE